jgi:hypothetical protein
MEERPIFYPTAYSLVWLYAQCWTPEFAREAETEFVQHVMVGMAKQSGLRVLHMNEHAVSCVAKRVPSSYYVSRLPRRGDLSATDLKSLENFESDLEIRVELGNEE